VVNANALHYCGIRTLPLMSNYRTSPRNVTTPCIGIRLCGVRITVCTEVFPCFFFSCKANARVKPAKTGHGPHSSKFLCCSMYFLCYAMYFCVVLCTVCFVSSVLFVCTGVTELLPPGGYPVALNP